MTVTWLKSQVTDRLIFPYKAKSQNGLTYMGKRVRELEHQFGAERRFNLSLTLCVQDTKGS
jgi:hypothetical protein